MNIIMLTQRSICVSRLQVEKHASLFVQAQNVTYLIVCDVISTGTNDLSIFRYRSLIMILAAAVLANYSP